MPNIAHPSDPHEASLACASAGCGLSIEDGVLMVSWPHGDFACPWPAPLPLQISQLNPELLALVNAHLAEYALQERLDVPRTLTDK